MNAKTPLAVIAISAVLVVGVILLALYVMNVPQGKPWLSISGGESSKHATIIPGIILLPTPPMDTSKETKAEIKVLLEDKYARSTDILAAIQKEATFDAVQIGPYTVGEYRAGKMLPELATVLSYSLPEVERVLGIKQNELKRTRPSVVEPTIEPVLAVPSHPSYPADYASKARFVAYVLSYIDPAHEADYLSYADEVAVRQEIAGVQYPLDSAAGAIFAEKFFAAIKQDPEFIARIDRAKAEWAAIQAPKEAAPQ